MSKIFNFKTSRSVSDSATVSDRDPDKSGRLSTNYSAYEDPSGEMGAKEFQLALWYARHKTTLHHYAVVALIAVNVILWIFSSAGWLFYYVIGMERDRIMANDLSDFYNYQGQHARYAPASLEISSPRALPGGVKLYDVFADAANPNDDFYVSFDYYFIIDGRPTGRTNTVLLARQSRPLIYFGWASDSFPANARLVIENIHWQRISGHAVADSATWQSERLNFNVAQFEFVGSYLGSIANSGIIRFVLVNNSSYGYVRPSFYVGLLQNDAVVGFKPLVLENLGSQEARAVDLRTFVDNLNVTSVKLFPLINLFNPEVYLPPAH